MRSAGAMVHGQPSGAGALRSAFSRAPHRVLQVVEATTAGVKKHVLSLATRLDRSRFDVTVACPPVRRPAYGDVSFVADLKRAGVRVECVDMGREIRPLADARGLLRLIDIVRRGGFDLVHAHSSKAGILARLAARIAGVPAVLYTPHVYAYRTATGPRRWAYWWLERMAARWTDRIICTSHGERDEARSSRAAQAEKLVVIHNGLPFQPLLDAAEAAALRRSLGAGEGALLVGGVGRLARSKRFDLLVQAAPRILSRCARACFVVVGDGDQRQALEALARRLGVEAAFRFTGHRDDVTALVQALDVFVLPSPYESFGYVVAEAMAAGRAVVAADTVGPREIVSPGDTGLLVPPNDASALAEAVLSLLGDREGAERMGQRARETVQRQFGLDEMVRRTQELYESLLAGGNGRERSC